MEKVVSFSETFFKKLSITLQTFVRLWNLQQLFWIEAGVK